MGKITSKMATMLGQVGRRAGLFFKKSAGDAKLLSVPSRGIVYTHSGGVLTHPEQVKFGLIKATAVVVPWLWFGATLSKNGAAFLEENDIFVPEDDDD